MKPSKNKPTVIKKATGSVLTPEDFEKTIDSVRKEMHKPVYYPNWYIKLMGYGKHEK